jgi:crossover junction endodeoxyribonuclease RuvC
MLAPAVFNHGPWPTPYKILGLDPGLAHTGWGLIEVSGTHHRLLAAGRVSTQPVDAMPLRLAQLALGLTTIFATHQPHAAAVEEVFVNKNPQSTLKLGQARAISLLVPQQHGVPVAEYAARLVKQSLTGKGNAEKAQVQHMVGVLLGAAANPMVQKLAPDAADALAVALTHAHHMATTLAFGRKTI